MRLSIILETYEMVEKVAILDLVGIIIRDNNSTVARSVILVFANNICASLIMVDRLRFIPRGCEICVVPHKFSGIFRFPPNGGKQRNERRQEWLMARAWQQKYSGVESQKISVDKRLFLPTIMLFAYH